MPEVKAIFSLFSQHLDPSKITNEIMIQPTRSFKMGDSIPNRPGLFTKEGCWELSTDYIKTYSVMEPIDAVLKLILPKREIINQIAKDLILQAKLEVVIRIDADGTPGMYFSEETMRVLAGLNVSVDVDLYVSDFKMQS